MNHSGLTCGGELDEMVDDPVPLGATQRHDFHNLGHILTSFSDLALEKLKEFLSNIYTQKQLIWLF